MTLAITALIVAAAALGLFRVIFHLKAVRPPSTTWLAEWRRSPA